MNRKKLISLRRDVFSGGLGRGILPLAALLVVVLALAGCGGDDTTAAGGETGSSSTSEEAPAAEEEGEGEGEESVNTAGYEYAGSAAETAEAKKKGAEAAGKEESPPSDKTIGMIQLSSESALSVQVTEAAEHIAEMFGYDVNVCDPQLQEQKFAECASSIAAQNPSVIFSVSSNAAAFGSAVKDAESKGIPWFSVGSAVDPSGEINNYGVDGLAQTQVLDEYMFEVMREKHPDEDKLKVFAITAPTVGIAGLNSEKQLKKDAEAAGDIELIIHNLDLANAPQDTLTSSRQTLEQNPELAGMQTACDFCLPLMAQTVTADADADEVTIGGMYSTPQSIADIRKGSVSAVADYAWPLGIWVGMDQALGNWARDEKITAGFGVFKTYPLPFMEPYVLTKENVGSSGPAPILGPDFEAFFEEKWAKEYGIG